MAIIEYQTDYFKEIANRIFIFKNLQTKNQPKKEDKKMSNKDRILDLYYNQHLKQNQIADIVGTSTQYVSKVVRADKRNKEEKECRKQTNSEKRKIYMQNYFKTYNRPKKEDLAYQQMIAQLAQDILELSFKNNNISDYDFAKWNSSAYHINSKGNLVLNRNLKVGFDVQKSINMNIKVLTQKYKHKYCYSY